MQKTALVLCLILFSSIALARSIESRSITIDMDSSGTGHVVEVYTISLDPTTSDFADYDSTSRQAGSNLGVWQSFLGDIKIAVKGYSNLLISSAKERDFVQLSLQYDVKNLAKVVEQKGRFTVYGIGKDSFNFYDANGLFTIPFKTTLWIKLNKDYQILDTKPIPSLGPYIENNAVNRMGWTGPLPTSEFSVKYQVETAISESFDLNRLIIFFEENPVYGITVLIILALGYIYRKQLWGLISEGFAGEEEIESPRKEL